MKRVKNKVNAVSNFQPSSSSILDEARPRPVFVVLHYYSKAIMRILQLETPINNLSKHDASHLTLKRIEKRHLQDNDYVEFIDFKKEQPEAELIDWLFSPPTSPTTAMYILPKHGDVMGHEDVKGNNIDQFPGYIHDMKTRQFDMLRSLPASKYCGHVVNHRGIIYYLAHPDSNYPPGYPTFEVYQPGMGKWLPLKPFPQDFKRVFGGVQATAVWDDTILYNLDRAFEFWAYNVTKNEWYLVEVIDDDAEPESRIDNRCYTIYDEAIVLDNTIYALTSLSPDLILELSIERKVIDGGFSYKCSLVRDIFVPGLQPIGFNHEDTCVWSRHLVYLGEDNFCLVQSCFYFLNKEFQPVQLTSIKLLEEGEKSMTVTGSCLYEVFNEIDGPGGTFEVALCFSLPEETDPEPFQAPRVIDTDHCIWVRKWPAEASKVELKKIFKRFGPIKRAWIDEKHIRMGKCFACVEFEGVLSKQRAVEASTIYIRGGFAEIDEISFSFNGPNVEARPFVNPRVWTPGRARRVSGECMVFKLT